MSGAAYCPLEENRDEGQATDIGSQGHDDDPSNQSSTSIGTLHYSAENTGTNAPCAEEKKTMDANEAFNHENIATWRPIWLQPIILASFSGLFLVFSILLLLISLKAKRSDGLFETWQGFRLAWRFGPTAVLTIVCAFWTRVEQQALRYMPWIAARDGQPFDSDLDYVSMITPTILVQSLRRRHFLVFIVSSIALILKVELLLAAGLFSITPVTAEVPVDVQVLDNFNPTNESQNYTTETLTSAFFAARAIHDFDMVYPFGVNGRTAHQTFVSSKTNARGTVQAPLKAVVDGFFSSIDCVLLQNYSVESPGDPPHPAQHPRQPPTPDGRVGEARNRGFRIGVKIQFEGCDETLTVTLSNWAFKGTHREWVINSTLETSFRSCLNLPSQSNRFLYAVVDLKQPSEDIYSPVEVENIAAVLCSPSAWLSKVEVTDDGSDPNITLLSQNAIVPMQVNIWDIFTSSVNYGESSWFTSGMPSGTASYGQYGPYGLLALHLSFSNDQSIANISSEQLRDATVEETKRFGPLLGHYILRQSREDMIKGTSLAITARLSVSDKTCLSMSALFLAISVSAGYIFFRQKCGVGLCTRDPATTFGLLVHLASRQELLCNPAVTDSHSGKKLWEENMFSPLCLRTWVQTCFTAYVCGLIACVSVSLHLSQSQYGLVNASDDENWQLLWTTVPSIVALSVVLYLSSCDAAWRSISSLSSLSTAPRTSEEIDLSTPDMFGVLALLTLFRQRIHIASAFQILVLSCGLLTTLTAVVFSVRLTSESFDAKLQQNSWFGDPTIEQPWNGSGTLSDTHREKLSTLFALKGEMNYTYPRNTFADLVFPEIAAENLAEDYSLDMQNGGKMGVMATIPALKLTSACKPLPEDAIRLNIAASETELLANATMFGNCPDGSNFNQTFPLNLSAKHLFHYSSSHQRHFGAVLPAAQNRLVAAVACDLFPAHIEDLFGQVFTRNYVWGLWATNRSRVEFKRLFQCNYSWSEVSVDVDLLWSNGELLIDNNKSPRPHKSTTKPWSPPLKVSHFEWTRSNPSWLQSFPYSPAIFPSDFKDTPAESGYLDPYFKHITLPYGKFAVDVFGDPSMDQEILRELDYDLEFTSAQLANLENRLPLRQDSNTSAFPSGGLPPINAITTLKRNRLVQSPTITYIIISILGPVFLFHVFVLVTKASGRLGLRSQFPVNEKGLVPKGFSSPGMMAALFHGTNAVKYIPANAAKFPPNELRKMMEGVRFRMGWFMKESDQTLHYTIGVLDDEDFTFMGSKAEIAAMERHRVRAD